MGLELDIHLVTEAELKLSMIFVSVLLHGRLSLVEMVLWLPECLIIIDQDNNNNQVHQSFNQKVLGQRGRRTTMDNFKGSSTYCCMGGVIPEFGPREPRVLFGWLLKGKA